MSKRDTDIALIRKYLNGELDGRAMHQLESRAQDDPFLMDALEGYEGAKWEPEQHLSELSKRLQQRITPKEKRIIPWRTLSIAASVLVISSVGWLWYSSRISENIQADKAAVVTPGRPLATPAAPDLKTKREIAANKPSDEIKHPRRAAAAKSYSTTPVTAADAMASQPPAEDKIAAYPARDTTPADEMVVMGYAAKKKDSTATVKADNNAYAKTARAAPAEQLLSGKVAGVTVTPSPVAAHNADGSLKQLFTGRIVDKSDGAPLPGVAVKVAGSSAATVTNTDGRFSLAVPDNSTLNIGYIGYKQVQLPVSGNYRDSLKTIAMVPDNSSLSEVVVTRPGANDGAESVAAHPSKGWADLKAYFKQNAISPDKKSGVVKLSFTVFGNGHVAGIKVIKSLSKATDQKAIDLLNAYNNFTGNTNGKPEKLTVPIRFEK